MLVSTSRGDGEDARIECIQRGTWHLPRVAAAVGGDPGASAVEKPLETRKDAVQDRNRKERGSREARARLCLFPPGGLGQDTVLLGLGVVPPEWE